MRDLFQHLPVQDDAAALEEAAQRIVREGMGAAAIIFLESAKPLAFLTGQAAIFATPMLGGFIEPMRLEGYANLLGNREFIERLIQRIEALEAERAGSGDADNESRDTGSPKKVE
ncbi:MAG TPA: hypothetical protein VGL77_04365 [Armatimonadota bacterium]